MRGKKKMELKILPQPDEVTCGPTSLHAVYSYLGYNIPLKKLISEIEFLEEQPSLAVDFPHCVFV